MFYRGSIQRRKLLNPRSHKKKKRSDQPEWDNTIQDLKVHAASPEEVLRRQLRHKSKNADVARRELVAKRRGLPADVLFNPGQIELEMKKLAILKEVLYDQNDFNEVLKKTDETMSSVKNIFHDAVARKSGRPNITLAPRCRNPPPIQLDKEHPSKLDVLSETVMDDKALNEQLSSEESEYEDDVQFESKIEYERFMNILKESMKNNGTQVHTDTDGLVTPEKGPPADLQSALNCTEEVKRTLSHVSSSKINEEREKRNEQTRNIDEVIMGIKKDASKLKRDLDTSKASLVPAYPTANLTQCSMSYEDLQGAMANVQRQLKAFETRTGRTVDQSPPAPSNGLAGFTVTLIDSVTRLTTYVNEGELRTQALEKSFEELTKRFEEQLNANEALAEELVNTQKVIKQDQSELSILKKELNEVREEKDSSLKLMEGKVNQLSKDLCELQGKLTITETSMVERGDNADLEEMQVLEDEKTIEQIGDGASPTVESDKKVEEVALKHDMLRLLTALKGQNEKVSSQQPEPALTGIMDDTHEAAKTIASVESHLRHLQLQHAEAQERMNELTKHAQAHTFSNEAEWKTCDSSSSQISVVPFLPSESGSLATLPTRQHASSKSQSQRSNMDPFIVNGSQTSSISSYPSDLNPVKMQMINDFPDFESDIGSFKLLEEDPSMESAQSVISSVLSSPHAVEAKQNMLSTIQQTQMSLEDRIAELNRQHTQAQERLQKLVTRRRAEKLIKEQPGKKVQICLPSAEMIETPHQNRETY